MSGHVTVKRRQFLSEPGVEPLLTPDPIEYMEAFETFIEATGMPPERVLATPVVKFPIPVPRKNSDGTIARWTNVNPAMMWHPLFWLPPHLALRYQYKVIDEQNGGTTNDTEIESDEMWAIRVMLELSYAGLYDATTGTWGDVLSFHGIDIEEASEQARVEKWMNGAPDSVLDTINMSEHIVHAEDPEWALHAARDMVDALVPAQWSLSANGILVALGEHLKVHTSESDRRNSVIVLGEIAMHTLRTIPEDETGFTISEVIEALVNKAADPDSDSEEVLEALMQTLIEVAGDFEPYVEAVANAAGG